VARIADARKYADDPLYLADLQDRIEALGRIVLAVGTWVTGREQPHRPILEELANPYVFEVPRGDRQSYQAQRSLAALLHEQRGYQRYHDQALPAIDGATIRPGNRVAWVVGPGLNSVVHKGTVVEIPPNNTVRVEEDEEQIRHAENGSFGWTPRWGKKPTTTVIRCTHALVRL
jgi:hypothetical protein